MNSESYWIKRTEEREQEWNNTSKNTIEKELAKYYQQALFSIEDNIAILYGKYAKDNNLTYAEANKLLTSNEFKQWRMSMEDYLNAIDNSKDNKLLLELNTLVIRKRISRLDKLYGDTLKNLYILGSAAEKSITDFLSGVYKDNYYENIFDIGKSISIKKSAIEVDNKKVSKVLNSSWSGKNYSQRIWKNTDNLAKLIKNEITNGVHRGVSIQKMSSLIQERMNVGKYEATRLVRTEMNYVQNQASLDSIKEADMKYFMFLATLDKRTSNKCREHDRKVYPIDEAQAGSNMPPLHPHCRSTIAGNLTDYDTGKGKRTAKDDKGNRIIIPAGMNYDDYYKIYVEKSKSLVQWKKEQWTKNHSGTESVQTKPIQNQKSKNDIKNNIESFTPLKTKQEALNYAQKLVSDSITIDDSLHINAINATLEAMYNIYKRFGQKLSIKRIEYYKDSYRSYAAYVQETQTLRIKGKNANFVAMQEKINKKNFASKWNASEDRYGILYHELGHMFETMLPKKSWNEIKNIYNNVKHDNYLNWMELGGSSSGKSQQDLFGNVLSRYALTDNKEFFAEAFSQIMSGKMRPVSRQVKRVLDNAFNDANKDDIIRLGALTRGSEKADDFAHKYYASVRKMTTDCERIAKHTGLSIDLVEKAKKHLFMTKHKLEYLNELDYFYPNYDIAQSWQRLSDKNRMIERHDLILIHHEALESEYIAKGYSQKEAHELANKKYSYQKALDEYLKGMK